MSEKTTAPEIRDDFQHKHLAAKLAEVQLAVERVPKRGHNQHFNYDFATESDITAAIRKEMAVRSLIMIPDIQDVQYREANTKNGIQTIARVTILFSIRDGITGEELSFHGTGEGADSGDKCVPKAITSALKYALLKLFLIPTGDDPEIDHKPKAEKTARLAPVAATLPAERSADLETADVPEGYTQVLKYELDRFGWHHATLSRPAGVEVKTKYLDKGIKLKEAYEQQRPVRVAYNEKSWVTKVEPYGEGPIAKAIARATTDDEPPPLTDEDIF